MDICTKNNSQFHATSYRIIDAARSNLRDKNYYGKFTNIGAAYADDLVLFFTDKNFFSQIKTIYKMEQIHLVKFFQTLA